MLASPVGGIEDYLHDGVNGFHIQRDAKDIAGKLDRVLRDPECTPAFAKEAWKPRQIIRGRKSPINT